MLSSVLAAVNEIQAGLAKPLDTAAFHRLLEEHLPRIHQTWDRAEELRNRIQNGERTIAEVRAGKHPTYGMELVPAAEMLLEHLRQELRELDWWMVTGLGMALAEGVGSVIREAAEAEGWKPPANSVLRIVMPGMLNLAVEL